MKLSNSPIALFFSNKPSKKQFTDPTWTLQLNSTWTLNTQTSLPLGRSGGSASSYGAWWNCWRGHDFWGRKLWKNEKKYGKPNIFRFGNPEPEIWERQKSVRSGVFTRCNFGRTKSLDFKETTLCLWTLGWSHIGAHNCRWFFPTPVEPQVADGPSPPSAQGEVHVGRNKNWDREDYVIEVNGSS